MVEIEVRLLRGSVYFAGEPIRCEITFTNTSKRGATNSQESRMNHLKPSQFSRKKVMGIETIAWASAQIHCQCTINDSRIQMPEKVEKSLQDSVQKNEDGTTCFMPSKGSCLSVNMLCLCYYCSFCLRPLRGMQTACLTGHWTISVGIF